jgi:hypothetical protein
MAKRKRTKGQTKIYKTLHSKALVRQNVIVHFNTRITANGLSFEVNDKVITLV